MDDFREEKLKKLALRGDHLAEYYLGKYYLEEKNALEEGIQWLLKSSYGNPSYSAIILNKLLMKYPRKIKKLKRSFNKRFACVRLQN